MVRSAFGGRDGTRTIGRLPWSRSPPHPNTQMSLPEANGTQVARSAGERFWLMRIVDHEQPAVLLAHDLEPALDATAERCS